jgi:integrase
MRIQIENLRQEFNQKLANHIHDGNGATRINFNTDIIGLFETVSVAPTNIPDRKGGLKPFTPVKLAIVGGDVMKKAGLPAGLRLMDLRRTAVSEMLEAGVPITNIMSCTGHATPQSLAPYLKHTLQSATFAQSFRNL